MNQLKVNLENIKHENEFMKNNLEEKAKKYEGLLA